MKREDKSSAQLMAELAKIRGFVMEHELCIQTDIPTGLMVVEVYSESGEQVGQQSFCEMLLSDKKFDLSNIPQVQASAERESLLIVLEWVEAQVLGWLLTFDEIASYLLRYRYTSKIEQMLKGDWQNHLLFKNDTLDPDEARTLVEIFSKAGLNRKCRGELIDVGMRELDEIDIHSEFRGSAYFFREQYFEIRVKIIEGNIRLVLKLAHKHRRGMTIESAVQAGLIGFMRALDLFEPSWGNQLSTYATWWIHQRIHRSVMNFRNPIRTPVHISDTLSKLFHNFSHQWVPVEQTRFAFEKAIQTLKISTVEGERLVRLAEPTFPSYRITTRYPVEELLFDPNTDPDLSLERLSGNEKGIAILNNIFTWLNENNGKHAKRKIDIIERRLGFGRVKHHTLEEVGKSYNVTRERIRQIEGTGFDAIGRMFGAELDILLTELGFRN